jgi:DNA polymerase-1
MAGFKVFMMTPDKDFAQLVEEDIYIYKPARMGNDIEIMGVPEVLKKWEITDVNQVIDILGLWGDAVDNIPGVPGVGEKTAKLLVQKYGSMEGLYEHTHELKGKQKENVENNREQAFLSKRLATIDINVPIDFDEHDLMIERTSKHYSLEEWKTTWMSNVGEKNALFISATEKENFEEFREKVYEAVREIHVTRFPYNKFLYPDYKDAVEED